MLSSHELARMHASIREIEKGATQDMLAILFLAFDDMLRVRLSTSHS